MGLKLDLEGCYGIKSLSFDFAKTEKPLVIHAPNGTMKTSLKKTLDSLSRGERPKDDIDGSFASKFTVLLDGKPILPECIKTFAFDSSALDSLDADIATMLSTEKEKRDLQSLQEAFAIKNNALIEAMKPNFSGKIQIWENAIASAFGKAFEDIMLSIAPAKMKKIRPLPVKISNYSEVFGKDIKSAVQLAPKVMRRYQTIVKRVLGRHGYLVKGVFELPDLEAIGKILKDHRFFEAGHKIILNGRGGGKTIATLEELDKTINEIKGAISSDRTIAEEFSRLESALSSRKKSEKLRKILDDQPMISAFYSNLGKFEKDYLLSLFKENEALFFEARKALMAVRRKRMAIAASATKSMTEWEETIRTFNYRFHPKYEIKIDKEESASGNPPRISFVFEGYQEHAKTKEEISGILSSGELRAIFLLDVFYQSRQVLKTNKPSLLLYDDISDSFDYANKNCIMEYFNDLVKLNSKACLILLTHNFDFYRLFASKISNREHAFFAVSEDGKISVTQGEYLRDIFENGLRMKVGKSIRASFALIPMARGIVELTSGEDNISNDKDYIFITNLMHYRPNNAHSTLGGVRKSKHWPIKIRNLLFSDPLSKSSLTYYKALKGACDKISSETVNAQKLEDKFCLALGIRVFGEKYCYQRLKDSTCAKGKIEELLKKPFGKMVETFEDYYPNSPKLKDLQLAAMLTSADLHINGFAYEPLIDYSIVRLRTLYKAIVKVANEL